MWVFKSSKTSAHKNRVRTRCDDDTLIKMVKVLHWIASMIYSAMSNQLIKLQVSYITCFKYNVSFKIAKLKCLMIKLLNQKK